jgi:hypothetical protein
MSYLAHNLTIYEHFWSFNNRNFKFCLFKRESWATLTALAGRMFETMAQTESSQRSPLDHSLYLH